MLESLIWNLKQQNKFEILPQKMQIKQFFTLGNNNNLSDKIPNTLESMHDLFTNERLRRSSYRDWRGNLGRNNPVSRSYNVTFNLDPISQF